MSSMNYRRTRWDDRRGWLAEDRIAYARAFCWLIDLAVNGRVPPRVACGAAVPGFRCYRVGCHCVVCRATGVDLDTRHVCWTCGHAMSRRASLDADRPER